MNMQISPDKNPFEPQTQGVHLGADRLPKVKLKFPIDTSDIPVKEENAIFDSRQKKTFLKSGKEILKEIKENLSMEFSVYDTKEKAVQAMESGQWLDKKNVSEKVHDHITILQEHNLTKEEEKFKKKYWDLLFEYYYYDLPTEEHLERQKAKSEKRIKKEEQKIMEETPKITEQSDIKPENPIKLRDEVLRGLNEYLDQVKFRAKKEHGIEILQSYLDSGEMVELIGNSGDIAQSKEYYDMIKDNSAELNKFLEECRSIVNEKIAELKSLDLDKGQKMGLSPSQEERLNRIKTLQDYKTDAETALVEIANNPSAEFQYTSQETVNNSKNLYEKMNPQVKEYLEILKSARMEKEYDEFLDKYVELMHTYCSKLPKKEPVEENTEKEPSKKGVFGKIGGWFKKIFS